MAPQKRATIYLEPELHRALRLKAAASDCSISAIVNDAVKLALSEDADDLSALEQRADERSIPFETFVRGLKRRGALYARLVS